MIDGDLVNCAFCSLLNIDCYGSTLMNCCDNLVNHSGDLETVVVVVCPLVDVAVSGAI